MLGGGAAVLIRFSWYCRHRRVKRWQLWLMFCLPLQWKQLVVEVEFWIDGGPAERWKRGGYMSLDTCQADAESEYPCESTPLWKKT